MLQEILTHPLYPQMGLLPSPRALRTLYPILRVVDLLLLVTQWNRYRVDTILPVREIWPKTPAPLAATQVSPEFFPTWKIQTRPGRFITRPGGSHAADRSLKQNPSPKAGKKHKKTTPLLGKDLFCKSSLSLFGSDIKKKQTIRISLDRFHPCKMSPSKAPGIILSAGHEATTPSLGSSSGGPPILLPGKSKWAQSPWGGLWLWRCSFNYIKILCVCIYIYVHTKLCMLYAVCLWIYICILYIYIHIVYIYIYTYM